MKKLILTFALLLICFSSFPYCWWHYSGGPDVYQEICCTYPNPCGPTGTCSYSASYSTSYPCLAPPYTEEELLFGIYDRVSIVAVGLDGQLLIDFPDYFTTRAPVIRLRDGKPYLI